MFPQVLLERYLSPQMNVSNCTDIQDAAGRFILPLDTVSYAYATDEGVPLIINGTVKEIYEGLILVVPFTRFILCGFRPSVIMPHRCYIMPRSDDLLYALMLQDNRIKNLMNSGGRLMTVNGVPIRIS